MIQKYITGILLIMLATAGCSEKNLLPAPEPVNPPVVTKPVDNGKPVFVTVNCASPKGKIMRIEQANVYSTTGDLPGENSRKWLQSLNHTVIRSWIQLRYVYNKGNINYNYKYESSNVPVESALAYYSTCADSLLVALSAYNSTATWPLPQGDAFKDFIKQTLIYYKTKYPKIKYIQVGNEPDHSGETMATYYPIYKQYYRAVNEVNAAMNLQSKPLLISNGAITGNVPKMLTYAKTFLQSYKADTDPAKKLDFFTFHSYGETNRPKELLTARKQIDDAMKLYGLPVIPVFVTEYGMVGGSDLPSGTTLAETVTMQPAGQMAKAFYLYEGGIDKVFNWNVSHGTLVHKSELGDLDKAIPYPYGNALLFCKELSARVNRIDAVSTKVSSVGLGINALAAMGNNKGIAVLVWNFNWTNVGAVQDFNVRINNIPQSAFPGKVNSKVYLIDSKNNNYYNNQTQTTLKTTTDENYDYSSTISVPLKLEKNSVALILLTPQ